MVLVGARLGEDFDSSVTQLVELGRKGVLVDADLSNRGLGWELPGGETIDIELSAVGSGGSNSRSTSWSFWGANSIGNMS